MIIHREDVQAVFKYKELKAYCEHKEACDICVFYKYCPFEHNRLIRDNIEELACDTLVSGELGEDLKEGDNK